MRTMIVLVVAAALGACGGASPPPSSPPSNTATAGAAASPEERTVEDAVTGGLELLGSAHDAVVAEADCPAKGAALRAWADANREQAERVTAELRRFDAAAIEAEVSRRMPDDQKANALMALAAECGDDPTFNAAWQDVSNALSGQP